MIAVPVDAWAARDKLVRRLGVVAPAANGLRLERGVADVLSGIVTSSPWSAKTKAAAGNMRARLDGMLRSATAIKREVIGKPKADPPQWSMYELLGPDAQLIGKVGVRRAAVRLPGALGETTSRGVLYSLIDASTGDRFRLHMEVFRHTPQSKPRPSVTISSRLKLSRGGYRVSVAGGDTMSSNQGNRLEHYDAERSVATAEEADALFAPEGLRSLLARQPK